MKKSLAGLALVLIGVAIIVFGMFQALRPVVAMYQEAMTDPMGSQTQAGQPDVLDSAKDDVPKKMFRGIAIGAVGLVPLLIGTVLIKVAIFQRVRRSKLFAPQPAPPLGPSPAPRARETGNAAAQLRDENPFAR